MWACGVAETSASHATREKERETFVGPWNGRQGWGAAWLDFAAMVGSEMCAMCARLVGATNKHHNSGSSDVAAQDNGRQGPNLVTLTSMHSAINILECLALRAIVSAQKRPSGQRDGGAANALTPMPS